MMLNDSRIPSIMTGAHAPMDDWLITIQSMSLTLEFEKALYQSMDNSSLVRLPATPIMSSHAIWSLNEGTWSDPFRPCSFAFIHSFMLSFIQLGSSPSKSMDVIGLIRTGCATFCTECT